MVAQGYVVIRDRYLLCSLDYSAAQNVYSYKHIYCQYFHNLFSISMKDEKIAEKAPYMEGTSFSKVRSSPLFFITYH